MRQVFRIYVERKTLPHMRGVTTGISKDSSSTTTSGYMNAMQFSHIWRMLTGESGNLYREIQVRVLGLFVYICVYVVIIIYMPLDLWSLYTSPPTTLQYCLRVLISLTAYTFLLILSYTIICRSSSALMCLVKVCSQRRYEYTCLPTNRLIINLLLYWFISLTPHVIRVCL